MKLVFSTILIILSNCNSINPFYSPGTLKSSYTGSKKPLLFISEFEKRKEEIISGASRDFRDGLEYHLIEKGYPLSEYKERKILFREDEVKTPPYEYLLRGSISENKEDLLLETEGSVIVYLKLYNKKNMLVGAFHFHASEESLLDARFLNTVCERFAIEIDEYIEGLK
ncbi:MAG: hypothetical protein H7A25_11335 [Leptospiraceae bacterium]|nr:hypothetical protein [Leptospiraceae bacterium]